MFYDSICHKRDAAYMLKHELKVSVPRSSLYEMVTVRCGHCSNLWSVNMAAALQSLSWQHYQDLHLQKQNIPSPDCRMDLGSTSICNKMTLRPPPTPNNEKRVISNHPPEKRQRVPSAYNQFIKEEIQRIKANNPDISHREAFSTAAKNWAHFPHIHFGLMLESTNQAMMESEKRLMAKAAFLSN
ncbi:hypothetical protein GIB67_017824 [Kingdonia uniflora]|uniref:Uncharacterized protein n=1 Tax=Kingdonia uniflora TaxID=39325 RepID=A0A7J7MPP8_9MAGN|nr:hypothetical protein GIB67_017824 [Kingdonia uniflora]